MTRSTVAAGGGAVAVVTGAGGTTDAVALEAIVGVVVGDGVPDAAVGGVAAAETLRFNGSTD